MPSPDRENPTSDLGGRLEELSDRQVEVLVYRVLAAVIAFLVAAGVAVLLNADRGDALDQRVDAAPNGISARAAMALP